MRFATISTLVAVMLAGCTGQLDSRSTIETASCEVLSQITGTWEKDATEFADLLLESEHLAKSGSAEDSALEVRIYSISKRLNELSAVNFEKLIRSLLDLKRQSISDYESLKKEFDSVNSDCANLDVYPNYLFSYVDDLERDENPCLANMYLASVTEDAGEAERYLRLTASSCSGESEWYEALRRYPYAMGFPNVQGNELEIICFNYPDTRACRGN